MLMSILNIVYVLVAIAMIALVLMQRGSGAAAGSSFGAGASGTVFGARGSANFLSKSTKWLAIVFFGISLFMAWYASHGGMRLDDQEDLGIISALQETPVIPTAPVSVPQMPAVGEVPQMTVPPTQAPTAQAAISQVEAGEEAIVTNSENSDASDQTLTESASSQ